MADTPDAITLSEDGFTMPTVEVLTGRGFITGKSGSGKSNTTSVIAEELLEAEVPLLIVDTDNEYYGLKEEFEVLHLGGDEHCDKRVTPAHAEQIAEVALERQVPTILDISGFRDPDEGHQLVGDVVEELFVREKTERTPFLVVVEEAHEFMPEQGGLDDVGETLIRVAKRGRKRGLGICALSQRPASVTKDYITQCDWLVWHRLTWENDTQVVGRILGDDAAEDVQDLENGEAIVMTDWDDTVQRVKFRRKRTFDAGATPDLDSIERPEFKSVDGELLGQLASVEDVEDADDAAAYHRGEDPNAGADDADDEPEREETHLAEVHGGADDGADAAANGGADEPAELEARSDGSGSTAPAASGTAAAATGAAASGGSTGRARGVESPEPAGDPAWEVAQFVTFVERRLLGGLRRMVAAGLAGLGRGATAAADGITEGAARVADRLGDDVSTRDVLLGAGMLAIGLVLGGVLSVLVA